MSIKGFEVGGVQERYDYTALDNTPANLVQDGNYVHTDNNFTNADKTKLDGIATGANKTIIDATLTQSGQAADAKAAGDEINDLKSALNYGKTVTPGYILTASNTGHGSVWSPVGLPTDEQTAQAVSDWFNDHPEATTTVQDGSLTEAKFSDSLKLKTLKDYITPEMFGAKGDGTADDSQAFQTMFNSVGKDAIIVLSSAKYLISSALTIPQTAAYLRLTGIARSELTPTLLVPATANSTAITINAAGVSICGIGITAQGTRQTTQVAIEFNAVNNAGNIDATVNNCVFVGFGECIKCYGRNVKISNCLLSTAYIAFDVYDIPDMVTDIRGFELDNNRVHAGDVFIRNNSTYASGYKNWHVHGNFIDNCGTLFVGQGGGLFVADNYLDTEDKPGAAIVISGNPSGIPDVLSNNYIRGNNKSGASCLFINNAMCCTIVKGNTFANFTNGASITGEILLIGNVFFAVGTTDPQYAVTLQGGANGKAHLNTFYNCDRTINNMSTHVTETDNY